MKEIEEVIGYTFRQKGLLEEALTHPSCNKPYNNQRLEFLGDSVLGFMVAGLLFKIFPKEKEGNLHKRLAALVCGESLVEFAKAKELNHFLRMNDSEAAGGGRNNPTNIEDMVEALFGAIYLDGGMEAVESVFKPHWEKLAGDLKAPPRDPKTGLQEWAQARSLPLPKYAVAALEGPAHAPVFTIEVTVEGHATFSATAGTKRLAEREAARLLLTHLEEENS